MMVYKTKQEYSKSEGCVPMAFSFGDNRRLGTQFGDEAARAVC